MDHACRGSGIWRRTSRPSGVEFSVWLSSKASEENRSMSWMTKGGSSSALGQSPLPFPPNELPPGGGAPPRQGAAALTYCDRRGDGRWAPQAARTTKDANTAGQLALWGGLPKG